MNLRAQLQNLQLFRQFADQRLQPLAHARRFDQLLPHQRGQRRQRPGDKVRQTPRIIDVHRPTGQVRDEQMAHHAHGRRSDDFVELKSDKRL